jgi:hypothetical protein
MNEMAYDRTYKILPHGKKFATVCRTDGYWSITWLSKNGRAARRKGEDFVAGRRTATGKYVTRYGETLATFAAWERHQAFLTRMGVTHD